MKNKVFNGELKMNKITKFITILFLMLFLLLTVGCNKSLRSNPYGNVNNPYGPYGQFGSFNQPTPADQYRMKMLEIQNEESRRRAQLDTVEQVALWQLIGGLGTTTLNGIKDVAVQALKKDGESSTPKPTTPPHTGGETGGGSRPATETGARAFSTTIDPECDPQVAAQVDDSVREDIAQIE